jgi:hypothetical protein
MKPKFCLVGDSWAWKGYTESNYDRSESLESDRCLADYWQLEYCSVLTPGRGNLEILRKIISKNIDPLLPIVWIYTEPGRDYGTITGGREYGWIESEDIFQIRRELDRKILARIRQTLSNPVIFIGGLSDINTELASSHGYDVLCPSWQKWIAMKMQSSWFQFGWGASDIGWKTHSDNVKPSRAATFAWDEQIKEWCWWEQHGWFCHEHPSPRANEEFAKELWPAFLRWLDHHG